MTSLSRVMPGGIRIGCVFPECPTTWVFNMTTDPERTNAIRRRAGWRYVQEVSTSSGLVWGWACADGTRHLIDGDPARPYEHVEETTRA